MIGKLETLIGQVERGEVKWFLVEKALDKTNRHILNSKIMEEFEHLIESHKSSNLAVKDIVKKLVFKISKKNLAKKIDYLINCLMSDDHDIVLMVKELLFKIEEKRLTEKLTFFVKYGSGFRNYAHARDIARRMLFILEDMQDNIQEIVKLLES